MLESIVAPTTTNPHDRSVFHFEGQTLSYSNYVDALGLALEVKARPLRDAFHTIAKGMPYANLIPYSLTDLLVANLRQSGILIYPVPVDFPPPRLPEFLRKKVFPREKAIPSDLSDALEEHQHATTEAEEEGFPIPSDLALTNSERLLRKMYRILPQRYEVYPTPDAEIAIRALAPRRSVIMLCDSLGGALCLVNVKSGRRRKRYTSADALPDSFLEKALLDLKGESI